jgi:iron only hydrogenase large subunit-like protein
LSRGRSFQPSSWNIGIIVVVDISWKEEALACSKSSDRADSSMSVFVNNLDDFISLSQACVNPFVANRKLDDESKPVLAKIDLQSDFSSTEYEKPRESLVQKPSLIKSRISTASKGQKVAAVSLNDCLACSGCVTSAETVLIQEQSYQKLLDRLRDFSRVDDLVVVCLSPQSIASMATFVGTSSSDMFLRVSTVLKELGVFYVLDTSSAGDVALIEAREEFLGRFQNGKRTAWKKPRHTFAASSSTAYLIPSNSLPTDSETDIVFGDDISVLGTVSAYNASILSSSDDKYNENTNANVILDTGTPSNCNQMLPMIASQCPGWICYAEKTQSLSYISHSKSPQQILGTVLKQLIFRSKLLLTPSTKLQATNAAISSGDSVTNSTGLSHPASHLDPSRVKSMYIVSVQPCFDKKLEGSRKDFHHLDTGCDEIDLVLSTTELWTLLEERAAAATLPLPAPVTASTSAVTATLAEGVSVNYSDTATGDNHNALISVEANNIDSSTVSLLEETPANTSISVSDYLNQITPDNPHGRDNIESMFRSYSSDGRALVSSVDSNGSSGGYIEHIFRYAAEKVAGVDLWGRPLIYTKGRNADTSEVTLSSQILPDGKQCSSDVKLKFGKAYGFRNIQSVMLKMKQSKCDLDFIEIMACPSGCVNGGGQLKEAVDKQNSAPGEMTRELSSVTAARVLAVDATFHSGIHRKPEDSPLVKFLYTSCSDSSVTETTIKDSLNQLISVDLLNPMGVPQGILGAPSGPMSMSLLHTRYHSVPKLDLIAPLAAKW